MLRGIGLMFLTRTGLFGLIGRLMLDRRVPLRAKIIVPAAIIYLISPFDFVPDLIPFAGWIDDILALIIATALFLGSVPRDIVWEHFRGGSPDSQTRNDSSKPDGKVVDGSYRIIDEDDKRQG